jgi:murein DD-endopeptidase MepM/ murein hydrolase activator NlpD
MIVWSNKEITRTNKKTLLKFKLRRIIKRRTAITKSLKLGLITLPLILIGLIAGYQAVSKESHATHKSRINIPTDNMKGGIPVPGEHKKIIKEVEYTFKKGDTFYDVLLEFDFTPNEIFQLIESSKEICNLKKIRPGITMSLKTDPVDHSLNRLEYRFDDRHLLIATKTDQGFLASKEEIVFDTILSAISGTIKSNLFNDCIKAGGHPQLILNFADIFAWDVDFISDIRENDSFKILFEEIYRDGEFVKYGKILAAEFTNREKQFRAFYFEDDKGRAAYYNDKGGSLTREFLKSPLRYSRISSRFSRRRFHPVLRIYRPHLGVDYAAPTGTPVETTCNGKIIFIGWKGGYGKCIIIRHNHIYTSFYGHLSRFAKGMKRGKKVKQGQVIGYVGSTGLATGPHLDYRFKKRGEFINPLKFNSPRVRSVNNALLPQFEKNKWQMLAGLEQLDEGLMLVKANVSQ